MKPAFQDPTGTFTSILVHFGSAQAEFKPSQFKSKGSVITLPSAWEIKALSEVEFEMELPASIPGSERSATCRGMVIQCRPAKKKGEFLIDLYLTEVPPNFFDFCEKLEPAREKPAKANKPNRLLRSVRSGFRFRL